MSLVVRAWASSDVGRVRKHNEDAFLVDSELGLYIVCDGMGGAQRGEVASGLACNVIREAVSQGRRVLDLHRAQRSTSTTAAVQALLQNAVQRACEEIYQASTSLVGEGGRMGTTVDAVLVVGTQAITAHVGDGRIYLIRKGECHQITEDHSLVQEQVREGLITPEQARKAKNRNVITRALGVFPSVLVDLLSLDLGEGDALLLCSDGLHGYVGGEEAIVPASRPDGGTEALVAQANARGGRDNITALVVKVEKAELPVTASDGPNADTIEVLRRCDLFSFCTYKELAQVAAVCSVRDYPSQTVIFREEEEGRECYIIEDGSVEIYRGGVTLAHLVSPAYFGEMSFIDSPKRSATAITTEPSRFLVISRNDFLRLVRTDSALATKLMWRLLHHLSRMVRAANTRVMSGVSTAELESIDIEPLE